MRAARAWTSVAAGVAVSATPALAQGAQARGGPSPTYLLVQALVALAVVIAIIYLIYFGLRRLSERQLGVTDRGPLQVIQAKHLGGDRWLYVVRIAKRTLVVGGGTGQVQPIADLGEMDLQGGSPDDGDRG